MGPFILVAVLFALAGLALLRWTTTNIAPAICIGGAVAILAAGLYLGGYL